MRHCPTGLGITGNLVSIWVLLMSPKLSGASTSVYLSALCFSDSLVQVVNILFLVRKFPGHETLRHGTCGLVYFLLYFSIHYSVIVMMGMTLERYLAIRFPLKVGGWCTPRRARVVVGVMCLVTFLINVHHLVIRKMLWNDVLEVSVQTVLAFLQMSEQTTLPLAGLMPTSHPSQFTNAVGCKLAGRLQHFFPGRVRERWKVDRVYRPVSH